ncbi:MAG: glycosyltransferase [Alphaproteobacteria bacterium]|nr:glycosyltransferase [Alphaproteobacteria bacterium]
MPKVYIAGAKIQTGGAYMAYHIGRLLARHFGYEMVDVHLYETGPPIFPYDTPITTMSPAEMERAITPDDLMVVNPSFSQFLFGLRLPGKKIMYIQDFRTFLLLDCHFDLYISVSNLVARYVHALYGMTTQVIPAFIDPPALPITPWHSRPKGSALVYMKNPSREHKILLDVLRGRLARTAPHIDLSQVTQGRGMPHAEFLQKLGSVRYLVNLSLAEGFGLVALEAMHMGTMVTGVDGLAGRDYMRQGENAYVGSIRDLRTLHLTIQRAFEDEALAEKCVQGGFKTAAEYGYEPFKNAWLPHLAKLLGREPQGA